MDKQNNFDVADKVAIVTGGYGVLGGSIAKSLAKAGAQVAVVGRQQEKLQRFCAEIESAGGRAIALKANVLEKNELEKAKVKLLQKCGRIDILINAAGGNMKGATIMPEQSIFDLSMEDFEKVTKLNLDGTVLPSLVFGKQMAEQGQGSIINISSMAAQQALTRVVGYSASKAAVENFTKWMAVEMAFRFGEGIRVNAIAPGFFIAEQNRKLLLNEDGSYTDRGNTIIQNTPMRRFGKPEELNGVIQWLASNAASFVTGVVIPIDGGFGAFSGV